MTFRLDSFTQQWLGAWTEGTWSSLTCITPTYILVPVGDFRHSPHLQKRVEGKKEKGHWLATPFLSLTHHLHTGTRAQLPHISQCRQQSRPSPSARGQQAPRSTVVPQAQGTPGAMATRVQPSVLLSRGAVRHHRQGQGRAAQGLRGTAHRGLQLRDGKFRFQVTSSPEEA